MTKLIRLKEVLEITGLSRSTMYMMAQKGTFPAPVKLSERCAAWPANEVHDWVSSRLASRTAA